MEKTRVGFGRRLGALVLDLVFLGILVGVGTAGGERADPGRTFARFALKLSGTIVAVVALAARVPELLGVAALASLAAFGGCFAALGPERQALHDLIAGTAVYRAVDLVDE